MACQPGGHRVCVPRGLEPQPILEIGVELCGDEAGLGKELRGPLADEGKLLRFFRIHEHDRLRAPAAVLGAAEGHDVDAAFPRHLGRCRVERDQPVGEARAVHMQRQPVSASDFGNRPDPVQLVERADLGRLGDRDGSGLAGMDELRRIAPDRGFQGVRFHPSQRPVDRAEPAVGEIFRRAGLVGDHMRLAVAEGHASRPRDRAHRKRIRGRACADEEDGDLAFEDVVECALDLSVQLARSVSGSETGGVAGQARDDLRVGAGPVVRGKEHGSNSGLRSAGTLDEASALRQGQTAR